MLATARGTRADEDSGIWIAASANGKLPPSLNDDKGSWRLWLDGALRFGDDASRLSQALVRVGTGYALNESWSAWLGYAYIRTDEPYAVVPTNEQRVWEQAIWNGAIGQAQLSSRTRLEQRYFGGGSDLGWRLREFVKVSRRVGADGSWSMVVSDEIFLNLNDASFTPNVAATSGLDRNRFFVGPGVSLSSSLRAEFGYLNQHTFRRNGPDKTDHILAFNLFTSF